MAAKGLADELRDRGYLVIDGVDGKAHYVALNARDEPANYPTGAVVEVKGSADVRAADKNIAALASDGLYRPIITWPSPRARPSPAAIRRKSSRPTSAGWKPAPGRHRGARAEGLWKVPDDLPSVAASTTRNAWAAWPWS